MKIYEIKESTSFSNLYKIFLNKIDAEYYVWERKQELDKLRKAKIYTEQEYYMAEVYMEEKTVSTMLKKKNWKSFVKYKIKENEQKIAELQEDTEKNEEICANLRNEIKELKSNK